MPHPAFEVDGFHVEQKDGKHIEHELQRDGLLAGFQRHGDDVDRPLRRAEAGKSEDLGRLGLQMRVQRFRERVHNGNQFVIGEVGSFFQEIAFESF